MSAYGFNKLTGGYVDALDAILQYAEGDVAYGVVNGQHLVYQMNEASAAIADGYYIIAPNDESNARWHLMSPGGAMSHVELIKSGAQSIATGAVTTVIYDVKTHDVLDEYDITNGKFTAKYAGTYIINAYTLTEDVSWGSGEYWRMSVLRNGSDNYDGLRNIVVYTRSTHLPGHVCKILRLSVGDYIEVQILHNQGATVDVLSNVEYNHCTIDRLA